MLSRIQSPAIDGTTVLAALHPELRRWFSRRFKTLAPAQAIAVPEILAGRSILLSSPTGSGKTLAAFIGVFDTLAKARDRGELPNGTVAVYVSPLRALAYDLRKNLQQPLDELGWDWLRIGARTGDTTIRERAQQRRLPPHILVTTPESFTVLLSQSGWLAPFRHTRFLILDELHALAENKRGTMAALAAERLEEVARPGLIAAPSCFNPKSDATGNLVLATSPATPATPVSQPAIPDAGPPPPAGLIRIGLSATVSPLETVAAFLVGPGRPCRIAEVTQTKAARIEVFSPLRNHAYPPAGYTASRMLAELGTLIGQKRTTLIFTNTRSGAEHIGLRLKQVLPMLAGQIEVHHASLDRTVRLEVEDKLKRGELRAVVCSTSLEMGIDIGSIDTVVMVSAPKGVSRALQRIGRSGHSMGETSHGVLVASNINDLADSSVPTVPRWYANKMPLASGLAAEVVNLRTHVARRLNSGPAADATAYLENEYGLSSANVRALIEHFVLQARVSRIPTRDFFLVERYDQGGYLHYFFHSLIGRSANDALSRIVAQRVHETKGGNALTTIDDYGFLLTLKPFQALSEPEFRQAFARAGAEASLREALRDSNLVKWQFRGVAQTGLMVPRRVRGEERGARALQWSSEIIFEVLRKHEPDHPLLVEAYAEATLRFLDLPRALEFLENVGNQPWDFRVTGRVSPFSFGMYVSRIRETMTLEDPETTIERLYHEMYGSAEDRSNPFNPSDLSDPLNRSDQSGPIATPRARKKAR